MKETLAGNIDYSTIRMLKERGLVTHFLAFVTVFCDDEKTSQARINSYMNWAGQQEIIPIHRKRPTQKQWIEKFNQERPTFLTV